MSAPRYAIYYIDPVSKSYVFSASGPNRQAMQSQADAINRNMPNMKAIVLKSYSPNSKIDPYHIEREKEQDEGVLEQAAWYDTSLELA